jgi:hypothetical protein
MLSHAAKQIGYGFGFGLHEAPDQFGSLFGPSVAAFILAGFGVLLIPAATAPPVRIWNFRRRLRSFLVYR